MKSKIGSFKSPIFAEPGDIVNVTFTESHNGKVVQKLYSEEITKERTISHCAVVELESGTGVFIGGPSLPDEIRALFPDRPIQEGEGVL